MRARRASSKRARCSPHALFRRQSDQRHAEQPDLEVAAGVADVGRAPVHQDRGRRRRVGRVRRRRTSTRAAAAAAAGPCSRAPPPRPQDALRRPPAAARAMCVSAACPHCVLAAVAIPAHRPPILFADEGVSRMQTSVSFATTTNCLARAPPARLLTLRTPPLSLHSFAVVTAIVSSAAELV